jgi:hypothetical protein
MEVLLHGRITEDGKLEVELPPELKSGAVTVRIEPVDTTGWIPATITPAEAIRRLQEKPPMQYGDMRDDEDAVGYVRRMRERKIHWLDEDNQPADGDK